MLELNGLQIKEIQIRRSIGPSDFLAARTARQYLKLQRLKTGRPFDIVHGHSSKGGAIARLCAVGMGVPCVYTPNAISTMNPELSRFPRAVLGLVERSLAWFGDAIIAVSPEEQSHLVSLGNAPSLVHLIPNGIDPPADVPDRLEARRQLGLPLHAQIVGFVGRFVPQKAPDRLVEAFNLLKTRFPDLKLALAGSGDMEATLRASTGTRSRRSNLFFGLLPRRDGDRRLRYGGFAKSIRRFSLCIVGIIGDRDGLCRDSRGMCVAFVR